MRRWLGLLGGSVVAVLALAMPAAAVARDRLPVIVQDDAELLHRPEAQVRASLAELRDLGADKVRVTAGWSVLTREPDSDVAPVGFNQADPGDYEQDRWVALDRVVRLAPQYGLQLMIDIGFWAPHWAAHDSPGPRARTRIDAAAYARFASAVARRYRGDFVPPAATHHARPSGDDDFLSLVFGRPTASGVGSLDSTPLPKVTIFTLWNEPNFPAFLTPQWRRVNGHRVPASPGYYRNMVELAYPAIKAAQPDATVLVGGTAATGGRGVPPLQFVRSLACVDRLLRPITSGSCATFTPVPGDGWAHHPYSLHHEPDAPSRSGRPDDVPLGSIGRLTTLLGQLVAAGRLAPGLADVWVTEYGYESNPPDHGGRFSTGDQARFLTWGEYLAWRNPRVVSFAQFLLRDLPPAKSRQTRSARRGFGQWESGLQFADGRRKLAAASFVAGLFVRRAGNGRVLVWGRLRGGAGQRTVQLQMRLRHGHWHGLRSASPGDTAAQVRFEAAGVFERVAHGRRGARYRLRYRVGNRWRRAPSVTAVAR